MRIRTETCCAQGCMMTRGKHSSLFRFPKNTASRKKWTKALEIDESSYVANMFVCSLHFARTDFQTKKEHKVTRLNSSAVPSLNLHTNIEHPTIEFVDESMVTDEAPGFPDSVQKDPFEIVSSESAEIAPEYVVTKKQKKTKDKRKCIVPLCGSSAKVKRVSLHKFPEDEEKLQDWKIKLNIMHLQLWKNSRVCSSHFHKTDFWQSAHPESRIILKKDVVPSFTT